MMTHDDDDRRLYNDVRRHTGRRTETETRDVVGYRAREKK